MPGHSTAVLNFGAAPGTNIASIDITGITTIDSTSHVEAYLMCDTTATHNAYEHMVVPLMIRCSIPITGVGFTIFASSELRLTGTFTVRWVWA